MQHIYTGTTAPSFTPPGVGHHYVNTVAKTTYISVGTSSVADWLQMNTGGGSVSFQKETITLSGTDYTNGYITLAALAAANSVVVSQARVLFYQGIDYSLSTVGSQTRITWIGPCAAGQPEEFSAGDQVTIQYVLA